MKVVKFLLVFLVSIICSVGTVFYLSSINLKYTNEYRPIPHMIPDEKLTFMLAGALFFAFFVVLFFMLYLKKYIGFSLSSIGVLYGLYQYNSVISNFNPTNMGFVPAFLSMGMTVCFLMAGGIVVQIIADLMLRIVRYSTKSSKSS